MANSDKDILITPNTGQSNDPKIEFTGATAGSSSTITMKAVPRSDGQGSLGIEDSSGESIVAFSEDNTGTLFSVTDDSGSAKFQVNATGVVDAKLNSGALGLPVGASTERPSNPSAGYMRWNSTNGAVEVYTGNEWTEMVSEYFPTGSTSFSDTF
tara:strand:- start:1167 stop:1631 length:465 start_codon:yes stop_codon:yes gene_type:complete